MQKELLPILKQMPGHLYWKDLQGVYLGCNRRLAQAAGFSSEQEIIGKTDFDLPWNKEAKAIQRRDKQVIRSGLSIVDEEKRLFADGSKITFLTNKVPLHDAHQHIIGLIGIALDITDYKKTEKSLEKELRELKRSSKAKTQLLTTVSHELRTPITGMLGILRALNKVDLSDQAKEYVRDIRIASSYILSLINDFLDVSKLEAGKMELIASPFNLQQLIEETRIMLQHQAKVKNLALETRLDDNLPPIILGDERAIKQIVLNFVSNAIKFTEQGRVTLKINLLEQHAQNARIKILVEDTGVGIPKAKLASIFDRYMHVDSARSRQLGGTGLGLALCKNYVELMGGVIGVESKVGVGTQFYCTIPFNLPLKKIKMVQAPMGVPMMVGEELEEYVTHSPFSSVGDSNNKIKILLVEDNPIVQKAHRILMEDLGCYVEIAACGELALKRIMSGENYDLIFMDVGLPDSDGMKVAKRIRYWEASKQRHALPIIALTAFTHEEEHNHCLNAGMDAVLTKPIEIRELECVMRNFIKGPTK